MPGTTWGSRETKIKIAVTSALIKPSFTGGDKYIYEIYSDEYAKD